jgi:hypothetical protein
LKIPLHHKAVVSSLLTPRRRAISNANFAVPKVMDASFVENARIDEQLENA